LFALAFLLLCSAAHADLFRWVDPESGSVKYSNSPPPWYESGSGPKVERVPYLPPGARQPIADPSAPVPLVALQARWREMLLALSSQPTPEGARAFAQLTAELDRADPAGAPRRKEELADIMRRLYQK
jgi:uncharacterized protein DUF4124